MLRGLLTCYYNQNIITAKTQSVYLHGASTIGSARGYSLHH